MEFMVLVLVLSGYVVTTKASLDELPVHPGVGGLYRGPNSETIIKGPDGSIITSGAEGGSILTQVDAVPIIAEEPTLLQPVTPVAEVVVAPDVAVGATVVASATPVVSVPDVGHTIEIVQPDPHIVETEIVDAPLVEPQEATDLVGPSGSISTRGSSSVISGPASTTILEPAKIVVATPVVAAVPVIASVKTPLRAAPVVEVVPDIPPPVTSFVLQSTVPPVSPGTHGSTLSPIILNNVPQSSVSTPRPRDSISTPSPSLLPSTLASNLVQPEQNLVLQTGAPQLAARIEPASSFGVIENAGGNGQISTTLRPELSIGSTLSPPASELNQNSLNYAIVNNRQIGINPSLIPSINIIPPEIGPVSNSGLDLGAVTVSSTPGPLPTLDTSSIQTISNAQVVNSQVNTVSIRNQASSVQVVSSNPNIPQGGLIGTGLANYGIDSTQINLAQVPLSSTRRLSPISPLPASLDQEVDDSSSTSWNRYGRNANEEDSNNKTRKNN